MGLASRLPGGCRWGATFRVPAPRSSCAKAAPNPATTSVPKLALRLLHLGASDRWEEKTMPLLTSHKQPRPARVCTGVRALYYNNRFEGRGILSNVSATGGFLVTGAGRLEAGSHVRLMVLMGRGNRVELEAKVARRTCAGLALDFRDSGLVAQQLYSNVARAMASRAS